MESSNLVEILKSMAASSGDSLVFSMVSKNQVTESFTYKDLDNKSRAIAALLQSKNLKDERVIIALPQSLDFIAAFFGCLYAGVIVVPSYPPYNQKQTSRIKTVAHDSEAKYIIADSKVIGLFDSTEDTLTTDNFEFIDIKAIDENLALNYQEVEIKTEDVAFIQYTSGSTGLPKGVMISHENIMSNLKMLAQLFENSENDIFGGWLPFFHDMGLITMILRPIYHRTCSYMITPIEFIRDPFSWLEMISTYKITDSGSPNFGYDACFNDISDEKVAQLDLSHVRVLFNGAEPVRATTIENFSRKFAPSGFSKGSFAPCYGMAEVTLFISGSTPRNIPVYESVSVKEFEKGNIVLDNGSESKVLVSSGIKPDGETVKIVNPDKLTTCSTLQIGEIWISGKHVSKGYWNKPELNKEIFQAYTSDTKEGPFLRTGDLGFENENGEVFITGRTKDLIIIRGKNYAPQDIEFVVEGCSDAIKNNCSAAFSIDSNDEEVLVVIAEIDKKYIGNLDEEKLKNVVRRKISAECGLNIYDIVFIKNNTVPRTTSGKLQRASSKKAYLANKLSIFENNLIKTN